ncbi:MAG: hypothetical protein FWG63_10380 [Defluviitaleaceae bacterium]|nr:hypothetical protein [Defluviitaleaceae bacterium]
MFPASAHKTNVITLFWGWLAQVYATTVVNGNVFFEIFFDPSVSRWFSILFVIFSWYCVNKFIKTCKSNNFQISISAKIIMLFMLIMTVCAFLILTNLFGLADITFGTFQENLLDVIYVSAMGISMFGMIIFAILEAIYHVDQKRAN